MTANIFLQKSCRKQWSATFKVLKEKIKVKLEFHIKQNYLTRIKKKFFRKKNTLVMYG